MSIQPAFSVRLIYLFLLVLAFGSVGCGKSGGEAGISFTTPLVERSWTLAAGQEAYRCRGSVAAQDLYIRGFRLPATPGLVRITVTVSDLVQTIGDFDCTAGTGTNGDFKMIYAAGPGANDVVFPAGKGVIVRAGQYVLLNMHLTNNGATSLSGTTQLLAATGSAAEVTTPVEMIYIGTFNINLPANSTGMIAAGGCSSPIDQTFLSLSPAMRKLSTHQRVQVATQGQILTPLDRDFDVTQQPIYPISPEFSVFQGDGIRTTCTYNNTTVWPVGFGDSIEAEMCFTGVYRYPVIPGNTIFECTTL
jgi:hypothetical protein